MLKVAAIQMDIMPGDKEKNFKKGRGKNKRSSRKRGEYNLSSGIIHDGICIKRNSPSC